MAVRLRNVTATGFELVQVEPGGEDGPHGPVEVHYLAVEPGAHILSDGTQIEAGVLATSAVQHGSGVTGGRSWDSITFGSSFASPPVLVAGLQTTANETAAIPGAASEPWLVVAVQGVTASGAEMALERSESAPGEVMGPETIGWVAIETGVMTTLEANDGSTVGLESLLTATEIRGWDNGCRQVDFAGTYGQAPLVVGHQQTRNGGDGGWLRRCAVDVAWVSLAADEDRFRDSERAHADEVAGLLIVERGFDAVVQPPPVASLATVSARVTEDGGSVSVEVVLDHAASDPMEIAFTTADGTAVAGADYTATTDVLPFEHRSSRRHDHGADPRRRPGRGLRDLQPDADRRDGRLSRLAGGGGSADRRRRHRCRAGLAIRDRLDRASGHRCVVILRAGCPSGRATPLRRWWWCSRRAPTATRWRCGCGV